jgi:hypothetical protein
VREMKRLMTDAASAEAMPAAGQEGYAR